MKGNRALSVLAVLILMVPLLTACLNSSDSAPSDEPKVLRILGYEWNITELGQLFEVTHDNVTIEAIDLNKILNDARIEQEKNGGKPIDEFEVVKKILTGPNPPDVVYLDQYNFQRYVDDGLLQPLDSFIEKDKFDIEKIAPAVRDGIRELGNGTLYALSPTFYADALFYNKDFFTKRNIPFPTDGMTWDEIFNLGRQLKYEEGDQKFYGLSFRYGDIQSEVNTYVAPLGLTLFDSEFKTVTINTPEWQKAWQTIIDLNKEGVIAPPFDWEAESRKERYNPFAGDDFITGRAAMTIGSYGQVRQLTELFNGNAFYDPNVEMPEKFEWDVVTVPVHDQYPDVGGQMYLNSMMAININAENPDLAWKYISFINGDRVAKVIAKRPYGDIVSRTEYIKSPEGMEINMTAFTLLKPIPYNPDNEIYKKFPNGNYYEIYDLIRQQLNEAAKGNKSVEAALAEAQAKAQEVLDRLNAEQEKNGPEEPATGGGTSGEGTTGKGTEG
jgi:multiple sugar transport system substrate-binding protein